MKLTTYLCSTVAKCTHVAPTPGNVVGIELELEGRGVGLADQPTKGWRRTQDGSLRGESVEFVLSKPELIPEATKAVNHLFKKFTDNNVKFNDSVRTSTHVHFNFADKPMRQAIMFFCLFTMLEEVLEFYSGEDRAGNLFCLSSRRTDEIARILEQCLRNGSMNAFAGDAYKYAACNLSTLFKFGTVEVRTMRGANSADQVNKWVAILEDMYNYSMQIDSPTDLIVSLSHAGGEGFLRQVFRAENIRELSSTIPAGTELYRSLLDGARLIQPMAYEFDEAFRFRPDPNAKKEAPEGRKLLRRSPAGNQPIIIRLDGGSWTCSGSERQDGSDCWHDMETVTDCDDIRWNEAELTFEEYDDDSDEFVPVPFHHARPIEGFLV